MNTAYKIRPVSLTLSLKKQEKEMALFSHTFACMYRRTRATAHLWSSEDNLWEPALSSHYVDSGDQTQPGLASAFYQLSLLPARERGAFVVVETSFLSRISV